ncbi:hypothetical protein BGZ60DRAFT_528431 [Tricladium varicosporioides]|nr:hypothetical protein BGZ60DRAFT_528431 [Hymenoscyphus varicosporioides]
MATDGLPNRPPTPLQQQNIDTSDRVDYPGKTPQDSRQFGAATPPISVHAKKPGEISILIQNNESQNSGGWKEPLAGLPDGGSGNGIGIGSGTIIGGASGDRTGREGQGGVRKQVLYDKDGRAVEVEVVPDDTGTWRVKRPGMTGRVPVPRIQETPTSWTSDLRLQGNAIQDRGRPGPPPPPGTRSPPSSCRHQQNFDFPASTQYEEHECEEVRRPYISDLTQKNTRQGLGFQTQEVHRYQTDNQTGRKTRTVTGESRTSASAKSSKVWDFDSVAKKTGSREKDKGRHGDDRRMARRKGHKSRRKSSWLFW